MAQPLPPNALIRSMSYYAIDELGHSQAELAELISSRSRASEVLAPSAPYSRHDPQDHQAWKIPAELLVRPYKIKRAA
jgi:HTH-type transcriptional regulator/antitoxin HigA